jgi:hypothetical protein
VNQCNIQWQIQRKVIGKKGNGKKGNGKNGNGKKGNGKKGNWYKGKSVKRETVKWETGNIHIYRTVGLPQNIASAPCQCSLVEVISKR